MQPCPELCPELCLRDMSASVSLGMIMQGTALGALQISTGSRSLQVCCQNLHSITLLLTLSMADLSIHLPSSVSLYMLAQAGRLSVTLQVTFF